ncbi:MAG: bifunctional diaminohydroxyphosphoribosylaminopyrimidine deaminase/5-amino-6-(5-phosphoribosylamino)uracil reductase RibD [Gammaproteobacteria bacterium]
MTTFSDFDRFAMARALELAALGSATTQPNPRVGCVIAKDGKIIGEGWHERAGGPHAEVAALRAVQASPGGLMSARDSTVYVNLEPCSHHGRTPPCSDALVSARVARVVFAIPDPNPKVAGRGAVMLSQAGIKVDIGLLEAEAEELNAGFLKRMRHGVPFVRVKVGMSLDGRTALANGQSKWITSEAAREDVQRWRANSAAVLTGIGTVLADDPQLNVRLPDVTRQPTVVVLDGRARTQPTARLFSGGGPVVVFTKTGPIAGSAALRLKGARVETVEGTGPLDLPTVLARLGGMEVNEVLVEAGPTLTGAFVRERLVDELLLYIAPKLLGPQGRPLFELPQLEDLQQAEVFKILDTQQVGPDLRLRMQRK